MSQNPHHDERGIASQKDARNDGSGATDYIIVISD